MRALELLFTALFVACTLTACSQSSPAPNSSQKLSASASAAEEFLLTKAAHDFHAHPQPSPNRFRNVRLGHRVNSNGASQYLLCGQFLTAEAEAPWATFATIKTSSSGPHGYEQWLGAQAQPICQSSTVTWSQDQDLAAQLQSRLESLR
jgi:outer membrane PBP1 activator LpoA protein